VINLRKMRLDEARMEEIANAYQFLARVSEWKKLLGET
jgi:hypothetical protein